jgi:hypothetical protein
LLLSFLQSLQLLLLSLPLERSQRSSKLIALMGKRVGICSSLSKGLSQRVLLPETKVNVKNDY